jgi:NADH dehydrogenase
MVGSEICRILASKGKPFRAFVRETSDPAKVERLKGYGAQLVKGDLRDPTSLKAACQGVSEVICTVSAMPFSYQPGVNDIQSVDTDGVTHLIEAAKAAGVKHFIDTSFSGNINRDFPLRNAKRAAEKRLKESGLVYTILRPGFFMEVWLSPAVGFDAANAKATVYGMGDQPIAWVSLKDVAQFAVESLENPAARNCALELGGPESLSPHQAIKTFEKATGKTFEVTHVPPEALQAQYDGATDPMQKSFIGLMLCYTDGDPIDMSAIRKTFAVKLTPLRDYVASVVKAV